MKKLDETTRPTHETSETSGRELDLAQNVAAFRRSPSAEGQDSDLKVFFLNSHLKRDQRAVIPMASLDPRRRGVKRSLQDSPSASGLRYANTGNKF